jgi:hypothetical protein
MYAQLKWSTGESYPKSSRLKKYDLDTKTSAIHHSLSDDFFNNTREEIDMKMADRGMITQRGVNPFLQTNYVNDVVTRDMYLKPLNTAKEKPAQLKNVDSDTGQPQ